MFGPQSLNIGVVGWAFYSAIPTSVVVIAVAILFTVSFIMLVVVADQIVEGEAVSCAVIKLMLAIRTAAAVRVLQIARTGKAIRQISNELLRRLSNTSVRYRGSDRFHSAHPTGKFPT